MAIPSVDDLMQQTVLPGERLNPVHSREESREIGWPQRP